MTNDIDSFAALLDQMDAEGAKLSSPTDPRAVHSTIEPKPRHVYTDDEVIGVINRMKLAVGECEKCPRVSREATIRGYWFIDWLARAVSGDDQINEAKPADHAMVAAFMRDRGFELTGNAAWMLTCARCQDTKRFPWADRLDVATVREFMNTDERCELPFELSILQETL